MLIRLILGRDILLVGVFMCKQLPAFFGRLVVFIQACFKCLGYFSWGNIKEGFLGCVYYFDGGSIAIPILFPSLRIVHMSKYSMPV